MDMATEVPAPDPDLACRVSYRLGLGTDSA